MFSVHYSTIKFECKFRNSAYSTVNKQYCSLLFLSGSTIFFKFRLYTKQTLNLRLRNNSPIDSSSSLPAMARCGLTPDSSCPLYQLWRLSCTSTKFAKVGGVFFTPAAPVGKFFCWVKHKRKHCRGLTDNMYVGFTAK